MTQTQKLIKYIAIALAVLLIVSIFSTILGIISNIFEFSLEQESEDYKLQTITNTIENLDIELEYSKLVFTVSDEFKVETNNEFVEIKENKNEIIIKEKRKIFSSNSSNQVIVYIPANKIFNEVSIESGSGNISIDTLNTNRLDLDLGAGSITFDNLLVSGGADIDSGAGKLTINSSNVNNLDLDMGVGEAYIEGVITGNSDIDAGIGALTIYLQDSISNYKLVVNKGIGEIKINNEKVSNNYQTIGNNIIKIDGGIGSININTVN